MLFDGEVRLSKLIPIARTADFSSITYAIDSDDRKLSLIQALGVGIIPKFDAARGKKTTKVSQRIDVSAVRCKAADIQEFQIQLNNALNKASSLKVDKKQNKMSYSISINCTVTYS